MTDTTFSQLSRTRRALAALQRMVRSVAAASNDHELLESLCETVVREGGYLFAWVGEAHLHEERSGELTKRVKPLAAFGLDADYLPSIEVRWDESPHGCGPAGTAIRCDEPHVVNNVSHDPSFAPWQDSAHTHGFESVISLPVRFGSRRCVLTIYAPEPDAFGFEEVELLEELCSLITFGHDTIRARAEREEAVLSLLQSHEDLEDAVQRRTNALSRSNAALRHSRQELVFREEMLASILDVVDEGICVLDESLHMVQLNERLCHMTGHAMEELAGTHFSRLLDPRERPAATRELRAVLKEATADDTVHEAQRTGVHANGHTMTLQTRTRAIHHSGQTYIVVSLYDDSLIESYSRSLQELDDSSRTILNAARDCALLLDPDGFVLFANTQAAQRLQTTVPELVGTPLTQLLSGDQRESFSAALQECLRTHAPVHYEHTTTQERQDTTLDVGLFPVSASSTSRSGVQRVREIAVIARDITNERTQSERVRRLSTALDATADAVFLIDERSLTFVDANRSALQSVGYSLDELRTMHVWDIKHEHTETSLRRVMAELFRERDTATLETSHTDRAGRTFPVEILLQRYTEGATPMLVAAARDVSEQAEARQRDRIYRQVFEHTLEGVVLTGADGTIVSVNPAFSSITGYPVEEVVGKNPSLLASGRHAESFYAQMWHDITTLGQWEGEVWNRRRSGEVYPQWSSISAIRGDDGNITNFVGVFHDISEIKSNEERMRRQAHYDPLTGLPNRTLFSDRLSMAVHRSRRHGKRLAVYFLDIDDFKGVNDTLGHAVGDELLKAFGQRLSSTLRSQDTVARLGGDEFVIIAEDSGIAEQSAELATRILNCVARPVDLAGTRYSIQTSVGVALFPDHATDPDKLVSAADMAMYEAKQTGKNRYAFFRPEMLVSPERMQGLEHALRSALAEATLDVSYQPLVHIGHRPYIFGLEALARWTPTTGAQAGTPIPPSAFIPLAEATGLIATLDELVLEQSLRQMHSWGRMGLGDIEMHVNISRESLYADWLPERIDALLAELHIAPELLALEVKEADLLADLGMARTRIELLHRRGVRVAVDNLRGRDATPLQATLEQLLDLPVDMVKVDGRLLTDAALTSGESAEIGVVVQQAAAAGTRVIAKGVERRDQLELLQGFACPECQGYLFGRPGDAEGATRLLTLDAPPMHG